MFTSFNENVFRQAIKDKDYLRLKVNTVSSMLNDPTFERGETMKVLQILEEQVPEIFEEYVELDYEHRLERSAWDKRYFTKLTYWFQENFAKSRVEYIKEVGNVVHKDTAKKYAESMAMQSQPATTSSAQPKTVQPKQPTKTVQKPTPNNSAPRAATTPQKRTDSKFHAKPQENPKGNFPVAGAILAVGALVLAGILLFKFLTN